MYPFNMDYVSFLFPSFFEHFHTFLAQGDALGSTINLSIISAVLKPGGPLRYSRKLFKMKTSGDFLDSPGVKTLCF